MGLALALQFIRSFHKIPEDYQFKASKIFLSHIFVIENDLFNVQLSSITD
jgi:hypothetical protein